MSVKARARKLWTSEGLQGLLSGMARFARGQMRNLYYRADFLIHEFDLSSLPVEYQFAVPDEVEVQVVESDADASRLAGAGYEDFRQVVPLSDYRLRSGAVGFCAYIERNVVHTSWIGLSDRAKRSFDFVPYVVDFDHGEGASGGTWTFPAYRGRGIFRYVMWHRLWYLREHGRTVSRDSTEVGNVPAIRGQEVFPSRITGTLHITRVLGHTRSSYEESH